MIVYFDTSALVKIYVSEDHSDLVREYFSAADIHASHSIAYVEAHAAFAKAQRMGMLSLAEMKRVTASFVSDWPAFAKINITKRLLNRAAGLSQSEGLRGYDSLHLAAAEQLQAQSDEPITLACFDQGLRRAGERLGFPIVPR